MPGKAMTSAMLLFAFFGTWLTTQLLIRLAHRRGWLDYPDSVRKIHQHPTPRIGGVAIVIVWGLATVALFNVFPLHTLPLVVLWLGGSVFLVFIGTLDDLGHLHPQVKLFIAMPGAALAMLTQPEIRLFFFPWSWLNLLITFLWLVGIPAAFNLLDGVDGLCSGVAGITIAAFSMMLWLDGQRSIALLGFLLMSGVLGFLRYNAPPAKIFLGDAGAMFLGFSAAVLGILAKFSLPTTIAWSVPGIMLGLPIFDTSLVTFSRLRRGLIPFLSPGKDHVHHRLIALGMKPARVTYILWAIVLGLNAMGLSLWWFRPPEWVYGLVVALLLVIGIYFGWFLEKSYHAYLQGK